MSQPVPELPALDDPEEHPDLCAGEPVDDPHGIDLDAITELDDEEA